MAPRDIAREKQKEAILGLWVASILISRPTLHVGAWLCRCNKNVTRRYCFEGYIEKRTQCLPWGSAPHLKVSRVRHHNGHCKRANIPTTVSSARVWGTSYVRHNLSAYSLLNCRQPSSWLAWGVRLDLRQALASGPSEVLKNPGHTAGMVHWNSVARSCRW